MSLSFNGCSANIEKLSIKPSHYDNIKRKPSSTCWCVKAILSRKLQSVQGHRNGTHDLRSYRMKNFHSRKGISSVICNFRSYQWGTIYILLYLFQSLDAICNGDRCDIPATCTPVHVHNSASNRPLGRYRRG